MMLYSHIRVKDAGNKQLGKIVMALICKGMLGVHIVFHRLSFSLEKRVFVCSK